MKNDHTITFKVPAGLLDRVHELVRTNRFQNQSEAFRYAMQFYLDFDQIVAKFNQNLADNLAIAFEEHCRIIEAIQLKNP